MIFITNNVLNITCLNNIEDTKAQILNEPYSYDLLVTVTRCSFLLLSLFLSSLFVIVSLY